MNLLVVEGLIPVYHIRHHSLLQNPLCNRLLADTEAALRPDERASRQNDR
jgi:hypothetical protein